MSNQLPIHYPFGIHYPDKRYAPLEDDPTHHQRTGLSLDGSLSLIRNWLDMDDLPLIAEA